MGIWKECAENKNSRGIVIPSTEVFNIVKMIDNPEE
jgi:hypothetical protein